MCESELMSDAPFDEFRERVLDPMLLGMRAWRHVVHCEIRPRILSMADDPCENMSQSKAVRVYGRPKRLAERMGSMVLGRYVADDSTPLQGRLEELLTRERVAQERGKGRYGTIDCCDLDSCGGVPVSALEPAVWGGHSAWRTFCNQVRLPGMAHKAALYRVTRRDGFDVRGDIKVDDVESCLLRGEFFSKVMCADATMRWLQQIIQSSSGKTLDYFRACLFRAKGGGGPTFGGLISSRFADYYMDEIGLRRRKKPSSRGTVPEGSPRPGAKELAPDLKRLIAKKAPAGHEAFLLRFASLCMEGKARKEALREAAGQHGLSPEEADRIVTEFWRSLKGGDS